MTVYSINKQVLDQASLTQSTAAKGTSTAQAAFAAVLESAQGRLDAGSFPSINAALRDSFDRSAEEPVRKAPERTESKDKRTERKDDTRAPERAERPEKPREKDDTKRADESRSSDEGAVEEADAAQAPVEEKAVVETDDATDGEVVTEAADQSAEVTQTVAVETQVVAAPVEVEQVVAAQTAEVVADDGDGEGGQQASAGLEQNAADDGAVAAGDDNAADLLAGDDGSGEDLDLLQSQTSAQSAQGKQNANAAKQSHVDPNLARGQADDLAERLAGTGADVKVKVAVDKGAAEQAVDDGVAEAGNVLERLLGREAADAAIGNRAGTGQGQNGQNGQNGQGTSTAAQQLAANAAAQNAQAAQGKAAEARPFAAALAAQVDGAAGQQNGAASQTQAVAGLNGANGTSAAQKQAQAQAARPAQQPQMPEPKQLIDQISVQVAKQTKDGNDVIKVQLKPHDLGKIEIKLEVKDGNVTAHVTAENKDTLAILQKDVGGLERALRDAGLKTEQNSTSFSLANEGQQQAQQNGDAQGRRSRRRSRIGGGNGVAGAAIDTSQGPSPRTIGRSGVDIKV